MQGLGEGNTGEKTLRRGGKAGLQYCYGANNPPHPSKRKKERKKERKKTEGKKNTNCETIIITTITFATNNSCFLSLNMVFLSHRLGKKREKGGGRRGGRGDRGGGG